MIYLIETTYYNKNTKEILDLLKIGYTEDNIKDRRFTAYKLHNPGFQLLYEIPGYNEDIERRIQYKFKDLMYSEYGREWFYYSEEIINFFKEIDKIDLYSLPKNINPRFKIVVKKIRVILGYVLQFDEIEEYLKKLILQYGNELSEDNTLIYLKNDNKDLSRYYRVINYKETGVYSEDSNINQEVNNFLKNYNTLPIMYDKLKLLCESSLSKQAMDIILDQIPDNDETKNYYITLGPDKLRALSYNKTFIKKKISIITFDSLLLQNSIYQDFKVGDKLPLSDIKDKLMNIYSEIGYNATPKAVDLENYFEVKKIFISGKNLDGSRKQVRGYELLSKKF